MRALLVLVLLTNVVAAQPKATRAFMREIAAGKHRAAELLDPGRGLTLLVYTSGEREPAVTRTARHLCGAAAERELARMIRDELAPAVELDEAFACRNRPGPPTCTAGILGEGMTTADYQLRALGDHLVIDTIVVTNSVYKPDDERRVVARLGRRIADATCE